MDPGYHLKKMIEELMFNITSDSILLYENEKGPMVAKTSGGTYSLVQSKIFKVQKINGLINVFGVYNNSNKQL
ncbi:MAG TPA: hypothetical protein VIY08_04990 [Candidatus Nitrosocosmicus sp.]